MNAIADTGFLVAFANTHDAHHRWAVEVARSLSEPALTCESVLSEAAFHLGSVSFVMQLVTDELVTVAFDFPTHLAPIKALAERYADQKPDLADLCLIRMSELHPRHPVITVDEADFRVYRRNKREAIPLICPP